MHSDQQESACLVSQKILSIYVDHALAGRASLRDGRLRTLLRLGRVGRGVTSHRPPRMATTRQPGRRARRRTHRFRRELPPGCRVVGLAPGRRDATQPQRAKALAIRPHEEPGRRDAACDYGTEVFVAPPVRSERDVREPRCDRGLIFGLIRLRSSPFIGIRINSAMQVTDVNGIRRTIIPSPENRKVSGPTLPFYIKS
jgi:hypothetical protein